MGWESNSYDWMSPTSGGAWASPAAAAYSSPSSFDWGSVLNQSFGLANTYLKADTALKMQRANGRNYLEGEALRVGGPGGLTIPPIWLLIGGVAAFVMLAKD